MKITRTAKIFPLFLGRSGSLSEPEEPRRHSGRSLHLAICGLLIVDQKHDLTLNSLVQMKLGGRPVEVEQLRVKETVIDLVDERLVSIIGETVSAGNQLIARCECTVSAGTRDRSA